VFKEGLATVFFWLTEIDFLFRGGFAIVLGFTTFLAFAPLAGLPPLGAFCAITDPHINANTAKMAMIFFMFIVFRKSVSIIMPN
jgi:hypothetical protein